MVNFGKSYPHFFSKLIPNIRPFFIYPFKKNNFLYLFVISGSYLLIFLLFWGRLSIEQIPPLLLNSLKLQKENIGFPTSLIIEDMMALLKKKGFSHFQGITKPEDLNVKNMKNVPDLFKFMDQLYREIGLLVIEIEKIMISLGFIPLPPAKKYIGWVTTDFNKSRGWRMRNLSRLYVPKDKSELIEKSILVLISLEGESDYKFPTVLCGILYHEPLTYEEMNDWKFYSADRFKTLSNVKGEWKEFQKIQWWYSAKPGYRTNINKIIGYLLNVFDLASDKKVRENIVFPLKLGFEEEKFGWESTIRRYPFAGCDE